VSHFEVQSYHRVDRSCGRLRLEPIALCTDEYLDVSGESPIGGEYEAHRTERLRSSEERPVPDDEVVAGSVGRRGRRAGASRRRKG
jgi:hypothetical protein